jgi:hypothetical protein
MKKITKTQAELLGEFTANGINFSPFVREQKDGSYLVADDIYESLKDTDQFKLIDWSEVPTVTDFNDNAPSFTL